MFTMEGVKGRRDVLSNGRKAVGCISSHEQKGCGAAAGEGEGRKWGETCNDSACLGVCCVQPRPKPGCPDWIPDKSDNGTGPLPRSRSVYSTLLFNINVWHCRFRDKTRGNPIYSPCTNTSGLDWSCIPNEFLQEAVASGGMTINAENHGRLCQGFPHAARGSLHFCD